MPPDFRFESAGPAPVAGIDEAGRGPWAGPVVAAAVILDPDRIPEGIDDSKRLSPRRRGLIAAALRDVARIGIGRASVAEIDTMNISQATFLAMRRALDDLDVRPGRALIDGNRVPPGLPCPAEAVVGGDARVLSIAAASIIAKVTRDALMADLSRAHPGYGWDHNAGYGTAEHIAALARLGVTPHHRRSFRPIHKILCEERGITY